jgi:type I restriction enzyme R subunit
VLHQIRNHYIEQPFRVDFQKAEDDAVMESSDAHQKQMMQVLTNPKVAKGFARVLFDLLINGKHYQP